MKILITGAGGFIGSHLVEQCVRDGHDVKAFVHYNSNGSWGWLDGSEIRNDVEVVAGDIRDFDSVDAATKSVDIVFHLAALIGIPYSYVSPLAYIRTNIEGTYNVLQSARKHELSQVLVTSTSETYGSAQYVPIDEKHPCVGQSPYSATKIAADQLALSFHSSFGLPVKVVRPFNTYGPRQSARAIIPTVLSQLLSGKSKIKIGSTDPTRDLTFVKDTVAGFLAISQGDYFAGKATNIGMGKEISIGNLIKLIGEECGVDIELQVDEIRIRPKDSEVERLCCNSDILTANSDWKPQYDLRSGIRQTAEWLKDNLKSYKSDRYSV